MPKRAGQSMCTNQTPKSKHISADTAHSFRQGHKIFTWPDARDMRLEKTTIWCKETRTPNNKQGQIPKTNDNTECPLQQRIETQERRQLYNTDVMRKERLIAVHLEDRSGPLQQERSIAGRRRRSSCGPLGAHTHPILAGRGGTSRGPAR